jgi:hypothetical protein
MQPDAEFEEFLPLWPAGFHRVGLDIIHQTCVDAERFLESTTRSQLFAKLQMIVEQLQIAGIVGDLWVDGSFVTRKLNPRDLDICLHVSAAIIEQGTRTQQDAIGWFDLLHMTDRIDSYIQPIYPVTDPRHEGALDNYLYWKELWGTSRNNSPQGIVVIRLG